MVLLHLTSDETWLVNRKTALQGYSNIAAKMLPMYIRPRIHFAMALTLAEEAKEQFDEQLILLSELSRLIDEPTRDTDVHENSILLMILILHYLKDPKLWELWYTPCYG